MKKLFLMLSSLSLILLTSCNESSTDKTSAKDFINANTDVSIVEVSNGLNVNTDTYNENLFNLQYLSLVDITDDMPVYNSNTYQTIDDITYTSLCGYLDIRNIDYSNDDTKEYNHYSTFGNGSDLISVPLKDMPNAQFCIVDAYIYYLEVAKDRCIYNNAIYRCDKFGNDIETVVEDNQGSFYIVGDYLIYMNTKSDYTSLNYTFYNLSTKESVSIPFKDSILNIVNGKIYCHNQDDNIYYYYDFKSKSVGSFDIQSYDTLHYSDNYMYSYNTSSLTIYDYDGNIINNVKFPFETELYQQVTGTSYKDIFYVSNDSTIYSIDLSTGDISNGYTVSIPDVTSLNSLNIEYVNNNDIYFSCYSKDFEDANFCHFFKFNLDDTSVEFIGKDFFS